LAEDETGHGGRPAEDKPRTSMATAGRIAVAGAMLTSAAILAVYAKHFQRAATVSPDAFLWIAAACLLAACVVAVLAVVDFGRKAEVALVLVVTTVAFLVADRILVRYDRGVRTIIASRLPAKLVKPPAKEGAVAAPAFVSPRPPVTRDPAEFIALYAKAGIKVESGYNSAQLPPLLHFGKLAPFMPLSGLANSLVPGCNEGDQRQFPFIRTDRYGFNNEDAAYAWGEGQTLIVGDSFAQGSCVHQDENVAGVMRRNGFPTVSVGVGGFGPILALASLREYGAVLKPKTVLWFYFDGNDIDDLRSKELRSPFVLRYLQPGFTQGLASRQKEVDEFWRGGSYLAAHQLFTGNKALEAEWEKQLDANLALVRELVKRDIKSLREDDALMEVFRHVLQAAQSEAAAWGGKIVFVAIPNMDDYHGRIPRYRARALAAARERGMEIVDVDALVRAGGDPLQYFPLRSDWGHFNARGYALIAHEIMRRIGGTAAASPPR
jgi:hypothetical protein